MRCPYCRSFTHTTDCPKQLEDLILPIYAAVHKLSLVEQRAISKQITLDSVAEAAFLTDHIKQLIAKANEAINKTARGKGNAK